MYDLVQGIQTKATPKPFGVEYVVGDEIELADGCYIGREGAFFVKDKVILTAPVLFFDAASYSADALPKDIYVRCNLPQHLIDAAVERDAIEHQGFIKNMKSSVRNYVAARGRRRLPGGSQ